RGVRGPPRVPRRRPAGGPPPYRPAGGGAGASGCSSHLTHPRYSVGCADQRVGLEDHMRYPPLAAASLCLLFAAPAFCQPASTYHAPRNGWGQPDLQGTYTTATITPLTRD